MADPVIRFDILTLFPEMFAGPFSESILKRAAQANLVSITVHDIRAYTEDRHQTADDYPFGGGAGLVLKAEPIFAAVRAISPATAETSDRASVILLAAQGRKFTQAVAEEISTRRHVILICGHYEGIDDRVRQHLATDEISIGDFVLTGGELAAMVVVDASTRLVPGVLGATESLNEESMSSGLLEYPQYTRPASVDHLDVPSVLLSGDHGAVERWRRQQSIARTYLNRPDLLARAKLSRADAETLASLVHYSNGRRTDD
jgi:tRNA (guanine37-N1)-methyltransferase